MSNNFAVQLCYLFIKLELIEKIRNSKFDRSFNFSFIALTTGLSKWRVLRKFLFRQINPAVDFMQMRESDIRLSF